MKGAPISVAPPSVLDPVRHAELIRRKEEVCELAGIPTDMLGKSAKPFLNATELEWIRTYPKEKGLVMYGLAGTPAPLRQMALTAVLLRNAVDARMTPLSRLIDQDEDEPTASCILVPNFSVKGPGKGLTTWQVQRLYDIMLTRWTRGKATVVYVEDKAHMAEQYGSVFAQLLMGFRASTGGSQ